MGIPAGILTMMLAAMSPEASLDHQETSALRIVWDLHISPETDHVTRWLAERGWCWAIEVPPHASPDLVLPLRDQGFVVIGQIHGHPETREWHWSRRDMETPDIAAFIELMRRANEDAPRVQFFMEDDSAGVGFSAAYLRTPPATHGAAKAMLDAYLETAMAEAHRFPDVVPWAMAGFAGTSHHYARHGARCIIVERANDDVEDLQTAVAFARGAARQFGCEWGIDLSLWWGVIYGCVQDLPASFYTRHLWLSYISGAQAFRIEGGDLLVRPDGPTAVATAIDAFARVAHTITPGKADAPVAVLLPQDHGWMTPAYWRTTNESWNYARLPYRQGDRGMDGFFGAAFPGAIYAQDPFPTGSYEKDDPPASPFSLSCITPEFAPTPDKTWRAAPPIPFGRYADRNEARNDFFNNFKDPSPYRPMGDSRWGDILDVITDDVSAAVMDAYDVLIVLGPVVITASLRERLKRYVNEGGRLIWAAGVASPVEAALVGAAIQPELRAGRAWLWRDEEVQQEAFRYCPVSIAESNPKNLEVLARARSGEPLVLAHRLGQGVVYTCLAPWFEGGHTSLSHLGLRLFDEVIRPVQPVLVEGPPAAWASARNEDALYVVIANHDDAPWQGRVIVRDVADTFTECVEINAGGAVPFMRDGGRVQVDLTIEPYGTRVLRWARPIEKQ